MNKETTIFVDCFNTTILRNISPKEVFMETFKTLGKKYEIEPSFLYNKFIKLKNHTAIKYFLKNGESEYNINEVFNKLFNYTKEKILSINNCFLDDLIKTYHCTELKHFKLNNSLIAKLKKYKENNKKIYLVSDFYCSKEIFKEWFKKLNIDYLFDDYFISCDYSKSKGTGKLYDIVLKNLELTPNNCIMIGDSLKSDCKNAKKHGINYIKIDNKELKDKKELKIESKNGVNFKKIEEIYNQEPKYNFSNFAFPLFLFTKRLANELIKQNAKDVFFFAREGQYLKLLFDKYCEYNQINIKSHYFYASRNSMLLASLKPIYEEKFEYICDKTFFITPYKFLKTLNLTDDEITTISKVENINLNKKYHKFKKSNSFTKIINNPLFKQIYNKKQKECKEALDKYINSFNIKLENKNMIVVDVGWNGTIQDMFTKYVNNKYKVYGYYIGARDKTKHDLSVKKGLLYSRKRKEYKGSKFFHHHMAYYEQILRANHNRVDAYSLNQNNEYEIIFDNKINDVKNSKILIQPMQKLISNKFNQLIKLDYKNYSLTEYYCMKYFYKMIIKPTKNDINWLLKCEDTHYDNFIRIGYTIAIWKHSLRKILYYLDNAFFKIKYKFYNFKHFK